MHETREHIKNRMLKTAAAVWGLPGTEPETAFDPVVAMLMNACAAEMEKISRAGNASQFRLMEKLAQLLTPDADAGAVPAHAIACALPVETQDTVPAQQQFVFTKRIKSNSDPNGETAPVYFTPTGSFTLTRAAVKYLIAKDTVFEIINNRYKNAVAEAVPGKRIEQSVLYIGMHLPAQLAQFGELTFFFEAGSQQELVYNYLRQSKWSLLNNPVRTEPGYGREISGETLQPEELVRKRFTAADRRCRYINRLYKRQFITLKQPDLPVFATEKYPAAIKDIFSTKELEKMPDTTTWFKVQFYETVQDDLLKDLVCLTNCFPVINRRLNNFSFRLQKNLNIVPLQTNEIFFDAKSVTSSEGVSYHERNSATTAEKNEEGSNNIMLLRNSGVGRFDERDASEIIQDLLEALRDESVSFSRLGVDSITGHILDLNKNIAVLEEKVSDIPAREATSYLLIKNKENTGNIFVEFWSTNGSDANTLRSGSLLDSISGTDLENKSAQLITPVTGGKNRLSQEERLDAYRKAVLTKDKVITEQDIRALCLYCFGDKIKTVSVKKGVMYNATSTTSGLVKTIDVELTIQQDAVIGNEEKKFLLNDLKTQLEASSTNVFPFRVYIKDE